MSRGHVATYLNDHLVGSVAALELLEQMERTQAGTPVGEFAGLRADILTDRRVLEVLTGRLGVSASVPRRAMAWLTEEMTQLKLPTGGLLQVFEALSLSIEGKRLLWRSLAAGAGSVPALQGTGSLRLERRAEEQRQRLETVRLDAVKFVIGSTAEAR